MTRYLVFVRDEQRDYTNHAGVTAKAQEGRVYVSMPQKDGHQRLQLGASTLERVKVMIADGVHDVKKHPSPHFKRDTILIDVPDRRFILAHEGDDPDDSLGCVLCGLKDLPGALIAGSRKFVEWLEAEVLGSMAHGVTWKALVVEPGGDVLDGILS